ncbi:MAG: 3-hydroxyacyl-CoA dehydrogenase NAD-binding domain-containing protein [Thermomicrobiales bacterium]
MSDAPTIDRLGMIGAGQMGNGIAHVCALAGLDGDVLDVKAEALDKALAAITRNMDRQVSRNLITSEDGAAALARISTAHRLRRVRPRATS